MFLFSREKADGQLNASAADTNRKAAAGAPGDGEERSGAHLRVLGLDDGASWDEITRAHARLVSDLTPGPGASHRNVALAEQLLAEVNQAFASLRIQSVA